MMFTGRVGDLGSEEERGLLDDGEEGDLPADPIEGPGTFEFGDDKDTGGPPVWHPERIANDYGYKMLDEVLMATNGKFQFFLAFLCALASFIDAAEVSMMGLLYPTLKKEFNLTESQLALVPSLTYAGMFLGAIGFGKLSDLYGRKYTFMASMFICSFFGLLSSFASNVVVFSLLRLFLGIGYGGNLVTSTTLLIEFVSHEKRGIFVMLTAVGFGMGAIVISGVSWAVIPSLGWRWLIRIAAFMAVPAFVLLVFVPESPRFYIMTHQFEKCVETMEFVAQVNGKSLDHTFNATTLAVVHHEDHTRDISWRTCWGMKQMWRRSIMVTLLPLAACWFLNAFANVLNNWIPFHANLQFPNRHDVPFVVGLIQASGLLFGTIIQLLVVPYIGRLFQLRTGFFSCALLVLFLGLFGLSSYTTICVLAFMLQVVEQLVIGTLYLYTPEVFPTALRVTAFGICQANHRVAPIIAPYAIAGLDSISFNVTCYVFSGLFLLGLVCSLFVRITTFNKPLVEESDLLQPHEEVHDKNKSFDEALVHM
mmetsp:Transcript_18450/g.30046  ORF Transcript_18450/g.30046 Transcript_18450/m.30046 type:complete len:536 (-) Transcript_18450:47-1654(-)